MYSTSYLAAPEGLPFNFEKKSTFVVIRKHSFNEFRRKIQSPFTVDIIAPGKFKPSHKDLLSILVEKNLSKNLKKYLEINLKNFLKENSDINSEAINNFLKSLESDQTFHLEVFQPNDQFDEQPVKLPIDEEKLASQNFLDAECESLESVSTISNPSYPNSLIETENELLRRASSQSDSVSTNSLCLPLASSFESSLENQPENVGLESMPLIQKVQSFFSRQDNILSNIKNHGLAIQKGLFNGKEKAEILSTITDLAERIENASSQQTIETLKEAILELSAVINNKQQLDILSRYRGFSPFKCFATLWGGGKVKSIEYVEQLRGQVAILNQEITKPQLAI